MITLLFVENDGVARGVASYDGDVAPLGYELSERVVSVSVGDDHPLMPHCRNRMLSCPEHYKLVSGEIIEDIPVVEFVEPEILQKARERRWSR